MLRLGDKYQVRHLRAEAVRRLKQCFPEKLQDYATRDQQSKLVFGGESDGNDGDDVFFTKSSTSLTCEDSIPVIQLACEFGLNFLLPAAFFTSLRLDETYVLSSHKDEAGDLWHMSQRDTAALFRGQQMLNAAVRRHFSSIFSVPDANYTLPKKCAQASLSNRKALFMMDWKIWDAFVDKGCFGYCHN